MTKTVRAGLFLTAGILLAGCTVHPNGEREERQAALQAGKSFAKALDQRPIPPLPDQPTSDDLVNRALAANAELEQRYWEWRAAIEQIPQDGTQPANLAVFGGLSLNHPRLDSTTLAAGNDPMADIVLPPKLSAAARRALENARVAGWRFRKAGLELREKVLSAYADYALTAELVRLEASNAQLLEATESAVKARNATGAARQQDVLKTENELALSRNQLAQLRSQLPVQRATLNALLGRESNAPLTAPAHVPAVSPNIPDDSQILAMIVQHNPELSALNNELQARQMSVRLAKLQYLPDVSLSIGTDLAGVAQSLSGMVTVPLLRYQAINAAVAQSEANLQAGRAMRRQGENDLAADVIANLQSLRDDDRQVKLIEQSILPRAQQIVALGRSSYEAGQSSLPDVLEAQRSLLGLGRLTAQLIVDREKRIYRLESLGALMPTQPDIAGARHTPDDAAWPN